MPDVGAFSETEDLATLDAVNHAIEDVLSSRRWEFDIRRGQITLRPRVTGLTFDASADSSTVVATSTSTYETADAYGDYIVRLWPTGSSTLSNTAFRALSGTAISTIATYSVATPVPAALSSTAGSIFFAEYILPDTVRNVLRVTHQEEDLTLEQIDPVVEFDELYPQPQDRFGIPEAVSVGGFDVPTYAGGGSGTPSLRMIVWPIPDSAYVLDYTYHYRHAELATTTDTLDGVPPNVVDMIVEKAAVQMKTYYEKDYESIRLGAYTDAKVARMHSQQGGMYADRKPAGNWDGRAGVYRGGDGWVRGRTIGGG